MNTSTTFPIEFKGVVETENKLSGDSIAYSFRNPSIIAAPLKKKHTNKSVVNPISKGGVTMSKAIGTISIKKTGAVALILVAMFTIISYTSGKSSFSKTGAVIIVLFSLVSAFVFLSEERKKDKE